MNKQNNQNIQGRTDTRTDQQILEKHTGVQEKVRGYMKRGKLRRIIAILSAFVLLFTLNSLKFRADTLQRIAMCGLEEHTHTEACYNEAGELVCGRTEHEHTDACYQQRPVQPEPTVFDEFKDLNSQVVLASPMEEDVSVSSDSVDETVGETTMDLDADSADEGIDAEAVTDEGGLEVEYDLDDLYGEDGDEATIVDDYVENDAADAGNDADQTVAEYSLNGGSVAFLSDVLRATGLEVSGITAVGEIADDAFVDTHIAVEPVEGVDGEYVLKVTESFDRVQLGVATADAIETVWLTDGQAVAAVYDEAQTSDETVVAEEAAEPAEPAEEIVEQTEETFNSNETIETEQKQTEVGEIETEVGMDADVSGDQDASSDEENRVEAEAAPIENDESVTEDAADASDVQGVEDAAGDNAVAENEDAADAAVGEDASSDEDEQAGEDAADATVGEDASSDEDEQVGEDAADEQAGEDGMIEDGQAAGDEQAAVVADRKVSLDFTNYIVDDAHTVYLYDAEMRAVLVNTAEIETVDGVVVTTAEEEAANEAADEAAEDESGEESEETGADEGGVLIIEGDGEYALNGTAYVVTGLVLPEAVVEETQGAEQSGDEIQDAEAPAEEAQADEETAVGDQSADDAQDEAAPAEKTVALDFTDYIATDDHAVFLYDASMVAVLVNEAEIASADGVTVTLPEEAAEETDEALADAEEDAEAPAEEAADDAQAGEGALIITGDGEYALNGTTYVVTGLVLPEKAVGNDNITIATTNDEATLLNVAPVFEETDEDYDDIFSLFTAAKDDPTLLARVVDLLGGVAYAEEVERDLNVKVFRIGLEDVTTGEAVEPGTELHVETSLDAPVEGEEFQLYHIENGKAELIPDAVVVEDGQAVGLNFNTVSLDKFALVYYTVNVVVEEKNITIDVDFTDVVENGVDFDSQAILTALNDGVAIDVASLLAGETGDSLIVEASATADVDVENLEATAAEGGVTYADGAIKVTGDGAITLTDSVYTIIINVTNYQTLVEKELKADGVTVEVIDGEVPAGSTVTYEALSDAHTEALVEEYIPEAVPASAEAEPAPAEAKAAASGEEEADSASAEETVEEQPQEAAEEAAEAPSDATDESAEEKSEEKIETATGYTAFDVSIAMPEGDEFTKEGQFAVTVDHAVDAASLVPEGAVIDNITYELFHIHNGEATQIEDVAVADGQVSFTTDGFSEYVIRYTVDFTYEDRQGAINLDFTDFDALSAPEDTSIVYNTTECNVHIPLDLLSTIIQGIGSDDTQDAGEENTGLIEDTVEYSTEFADGFEFDINAAEKVDAADGVDFVDGELVITADGYIDLTDGTANLHISIGGLSALKEELLEAEGVKVEVLEGNVPLGSEASYEAHTKEETEGLVEQYIKTDISDGESLENIEQTATVGYRAADLKIVRDGEDLPVEGQFKVTVDKASLVPAGMKLEKLYHIHRDENGETTVDPLDVDETEDGLVFEVANFSDIVAKYTVEFHNGDAQVVIKGGSQVLLSALIGGLGLTRVDGSTFTVDDVDKVEFATPDLFDVREVLNGEEITFDNGVEETVVIVTEHDFLITSLKPFDEDWMILTLKDGTLIVVRVTDDNEGSYPVTHTTTVKFYNADAVYNSTENKITSDDSYMEAPTPALNDYYYALAWCKRTVYNEASKKYEEKTLWKVQPIEFKDMGEASSISVSFSDGFKSSDPDDEETYDLLNTDYGTDGTGFKTRIWHSTSNISVNDLEFELNESGNKGLLSSTTGASIDENIEPLHNYRGEEKVGDTSNIIYVQNTNHYTYRIRLRFDPESVNPLQGEGEGTAQDNGRYYYVLARIKHRSGDYSYAYEKINVPDPTLLPVDDDGYYYIDYDYGYDPTTHTYKNWKPFQTETVTSFFTGLEEKIEVKVVQSWKKDGFIPQALISNSAGPLTNDLRNSKYDGVIFEEGDAVTSYNVHYDTKASRGGNSNYRTMREGNVIICYDTINLSSNSVTSDYDYTTILGPNMVYGIVAEHLYQPNHLQTNFAVNHFSAHGHDVRPDLSGPNSGNIVIAQFNESDGSRRNSVGNVAYDPTWGRLKVGKPLNGTLMVYVDQDSGYSENGQLANVYDNPGQTVVIPTDGQSLSENIVEPGIEYGKRMSAILASKGANVSATIQGNKAIIDTRDYPENATIYVNADLIRSYIGRSGGLEINKKDNQTIIFNFTDDVDSREVTINQFVVKQPSFANYGYSNGYKTESPEATGSDQNKVMDDIARHIVWNLRGCLRKVTIDTAGGIFLQPNDNSEIEIKGTTAGWIVSDGYVYNGTAEWHNVFEEMPDGVQVNLYALKYVNDKMPTKDEKFTFQLEQYKFEYSSINAEGKVNANWVTLNSTTTNDYSLVKFPTLTQDDLKLGWNIFRIKEVGKADSTDGSYVTDQTEYYAAVLLQRYSIHDEEDSRKIKLEYTVSQPRFFKSWNEDNYKPYNSNSYTDINTVPTGVYGERVAIPSFKNEKTVTGLTLTKRVNGTDDTHQSFTFRVTLWTETTDNGVTTRHPLSMDSLTVTGVSGKSVALTHETDHSYADITLKNGRKVVIKDLPAGVHYSIVEYKIGDTVVTDPSQAIGHYKPVPVGEDGEHNPIYAIVDEMETNNDSKVAAFYNDYDASGSINLNVVKTLTNEDAEPVALTEGQFIFTLSGNSTSVRGYNLASNEEAPGKAAQVVFRFNGENEAPTAALNFTQADMAGATKNEAGYYTKEITYILHESEGTRAGFDYDSVVYPEDKVITLVLTDMGDGTIDVKVKDTNDTTVGLTFENTQKKKAQATLQGTKTMEGREMTKAEFIFNAKLVKVGLDNVSDAAIAAAVSAATAEGATDEQKAEPDRLRNLRKQASPVNVIGFNGKADTPDEEEGTTYTSDITFPTISYTEPGAYVYEITEDTSSMPEDARQKVGSTKTWYAKVVVAPNMTAVVTYCDTIDGTYTATPTPNFVNEEKKIGFKVTKLWDDQEGRKAEGPKEITFSLTHNNTDKVLNAVLAAHVAKENGTSGSVEVVGDTVILTSDASGNWPTAVFTEMPAGRYQVKEESHSATASGSVVTTYTLPNPTDDDPDGVRNSSIVRDGETLTINNRETKDTYTNIAVNKVWKVGENTYVPTSGSASFELYEVKTSSASGSGFKYKDQHRNEIIDGSLASLITVRYIVDGTDEEGQNNIVTKAPTDYKLAGITYCESFDKNGNMSGNKQSINDRIAPKVTRLDDFKVALDYDIPIPDPVTMDSGTAFTVGGVNAQVDNETQLTVKSFAILSNSESRICTFTLSNANNWRWNSGTLPLSKNDGEITWKYYLKEINVPNPPFEVSFSNGGTGDRSGLITSGGATVTATNTQTDTVERYVKKAWSLADVDLPEGTEVVLGLYAGKTETAALATEPMRTITLDGTADEVLDENNNQELDGWQAKFANLPKYGTDGTELVYIVKEISGPEGFAVQYGTNVTAEYVLASNSATVPDASTITNNQLGNGSLTVTKSEVDVTNTLPNASRIYKLAVKDSNGTYYAKNGDPIMAQDGVTPATDPGESGWVEFTVPAVNEGDDTATWLNLPTGTYTVEEYGYNTVYTVTADGDSTDYLWTVSGLDGVRVAPGADTEKQVVNTFDTVTTDIPVTKTWSDDYDGDWTVTFKLQSSRRVYARNGVVVNYSSANAGWSAFADVEVSPSEALTLTITNETPVADSKFANQPKYVEDPQGSGVVYELRYTAVETGYTTGNGKTYKVEAISEVTRNADGTFNAIEAVNTPENNKTKVKVEKVWSDGNEKHDGKSVQLRLVRYKAGVPMQKLTISHKGAGINGDNLPEGFAATYTITGGKTVFDNPVSAGDYDVEPGTYTVTVSVSDPAAPAEKVYNGTTPASTEVTITKDAGGTAEFVSSYGDKQYGNLVIRQGVSGLDSLPEEFSATYTISNGSNVVQDNATADTGYRLEAGISYTVTANVSGETVENYNVSTNSPQLIVNADSTVEANVVTTYTWAGGYLTFTHVADPTSLSLPSGITYAVTGGTTTISNPVPGTEYKVLPGTYTVTASGVGAISGYTRNESQPDESKPVSVGVGEHKSVALKSYYTSDRQVKLTVMRGQWNAENVINGYNEIDIIFGSSVTLKVKTKGTPEARYWSKGYNYNWESTKIESSGDPVRDGSYNIYTFVVSNIVDNIILGVATRDNDNDATIEVIIGNGTSALATSPVQLAFNPFTAYADEDHSTISEMAAAGYGRDETYNASAPTVTVSDANNWSGLIDNLDVYDEYGQPYYYGIEEVEVPEGFTVRCSDPWNAESMRDATQTVTLTATNTPDEPDVETVPDSVTVQKQDDKGSPLPGATFKLYSTNNSGTLSGEVATYGGSGVSSFTISTGDLALANYLPTTNGGTRTLYLKETEAPTGYLLSDMVYDVVISTSITNPTWNEAQKKYITTTTYTMTIGGDESKDVPNTPKTGSVTFTQKKIFTNGAQATKFGYSVTEYTDNTYGTVKAVITDKGEMSVSADGVTTVNYTLADVGHHYYIVKENLPEGVTPTDADRKNGYIIHEGVKYDLKEYRYDVEVSIGDTALDVKKDAETVSDIESTFTNEQLGELQITKNIEAQRNEDRTGTFWYAVFNAADVDPETRQPKSNTHTVRIGSIQVTTGGTNTMTESDLPYGEYYVFELKEEPTIEGTTEHLTIIPNDTDAVIGGKVYTVTGSGTTATSVNATAGISTLINTVPETDFDFTKEWLISGSSTKQDNWPGSVTIPSFTLERILVWKDAEGTEHPTTVDGSFSAVFSDVGENVANKEPDASSSLDNFTDICMNRTGEGNDFTYTVSKLPKYGSMTVDGTVRVGEWKYRVREAQVSGYNAPVYLTSEHGATNNQFAEDGGIIQNYMITVSLPATGGPGTSMFYVFGSIITLLAAVLLITKRRSGSAE